jgi:hypothetical protein
MNLAKQHFASLREINTQLNHACNQKEKSTCGWCGVGVDLLLLSDGELWLLLACPSPPGLAPSACPSPPSQLPVACPSPLGQGLLHLAFFFNFQGFNPWLWFTGWCGGDVRTGVLLVFWFWSNGCVLLPAVHYLQLLDLLGCCGDANTTLSQCD